MSFDSLLQLPQYSLPQKEKEAILGKELEALTEYHRTRSEAYARLLRVLHPHYRGVRSLSNVPYLPVGLFKSHMLQSVPDADVFKILRSSGTTGQRPSIVPLDRETARRQTVALSRIMMHVLGPKRMPMLLVESPSLILDRRQFNARVAGLLGMMNFGRNHTYALDAALQLDIHGIRAFLDQFGHEPFLLFGFTFVVWHNFLLQLKGQKLDFSNGILIHTGGWKKLQEQSVSQEEFRQRFGEEIGLTRIFNFYGMVEQVGSVFLEGEDGLLYPPNFGDVIVRDPVTLQELPPGEVGILQVLSLLPLSYPGHSLLTEDLGRIHSIDDSSCGRRGKAFSVLGRLPQAEMRGCSDVIASMEAA
jgi:phenylacetate-coenzyme A ligase PaaK-like adenylate-forming protein